MRNICDSFFRQILRFFAILIVRYLQKRYKSLSLSKYDRSSQFYSKLRLIQAILYYFKKQFHAWGYFHPSCVWTDKDEKFFRSLFPQKDFEEIEAIVWHNPEAVTYYHNKIWELTKQRPPAYGKEIKKQLIEWENWN